MLLPFIFALLGVTLAEDYVHNPIQYHSQTDRGSYNYGYDTGLFGSHQFHQENKDDAGQVRGRYGYTDPEGKLKLVYYTAGNEGFNVYGDSAPDSAPAPVRTKVVAPVEKVKVRYSTSSSSSKSHPPPAHLPPSKVYVVKPTYEEHIEEAQPRAEHDHHHKHHRNHDNHQEPSIKSPVTTPKPAKPRFEPKVQQEEKVQHHQKVHVPEKSYYSPAQHYRARGKNEVKSSGKSYNTPVAISPADFRDKYAPNYKPAGSYSRCFCE